MSGQTITDADIRRLLGFDPLEAAEKFTGRSYKDDLRTQLLGVALGDRNAQKKRAALVATKDTYRNMEYADLQRVFLRLGFETLVERSFLTSPVSGQPDRRELLHLHWHDSGILGMTTSYGAQANSAAIYYNWLAHPGEQAWDYISSGGLHSPSYDRGEQVLVGSHRVEEGLGHTLRRMQEAGTFLPIWREQPFLWLLSYVQENEPGYDYRAINAETLRMLPRLVQSAVLGTESAW